MKYVIDEMQPYGIIVTFEDGSRASVGVHTEATAEEIDHLVSFYDPDYAPDPETQINPNVTAGEERTSVRMVEEEQASRGQEDETVDFTPLPVTDAFSIQHITFAALRYEREGDSSVMEALEDFFTTAYDGISAPILVDLIGQIKANKEIELVLEQQAQAEAEALFATALEELESE